MAYREVTMLEVKKSSGCGWTACNFSKLVALSKCHCRPG